MTTTQDEDGAQPAYRKGPVQLRRDQVPGETTDQRLLDSRGPHDWVHTDPWRVLRIQSEFVEGFGALAEPAARRQRLRVGPHPRRLGRVPHRRRHRPRARRGRLRGDHRRRARRDAGGQRGCLRGRRGQRRAGHRACRTSRA
ncbi:hypothetical protein GCM10025868_12790 [Angustibacter aerolatus]|uniref:TIGR00730 family Rossman fold protein n=1 Tax=Angustibacter aerolatus TaxID=1162965 RepID=A0ABQ6JFW0_9ACTN|nr:hypothetical protein [Angustibacter aerolatus]GMA86029.1 hypothetical protein GCM10025868_12790 [Angustibacter aerolatus]